MYDSFLLVGASRQSAGGGATAHSPLQHVQAERCIHAPEHPGSIGQLSATHERHLLTCSTTPGVAL